MVAVKTVLIADDTAFVRDRFRTALEGAGLALPGLHHGFGKGLETAHGIGASKIQIQINIGQRPLGMAMVALARLASPCSRSKTRRASG